MDIRIGIINVARELSVQVADESGPDVKAELEAALNEGRPMAWVTDRDGREIGVPVAHLAYIEFGSPDGSRRIGFAAE